MIFLVFAILLSVRSSRADEVNQGGGFSIRKEPSSTTDALEDFERYRDKKAWEKAFAAIGKISDPKGDRLVPDKDGFFIPTPRKVREELLSLPPEGREAYRLFNDARAEKLLQEWVARDADVSGASPAAGTDGRDEIASLRKIVDLYFITSVGDRAADRLGDALFEAGDFSGAESCWRLILDSFPDTSLLPALLQTKRAIALARAERWAEVAEVRSIVASRYAGAPVRIGGEEISADAFLNRLGAGTPLAAGSTTRPDEMTVSTLAQPVPAPTPISFPAADAPAWQIQLIDSASAEQVQQQLGRFGWGGGTANRILDAVPSTAVDEHRIYVNWFGIVFAADLKTGKLLWRTESFSALPQKFQQMFMQGEMPSSDSCEVVLAGDKVICVGRSPYARNNSNDRNLHLACLAADTGKAVWKSDKGALKDWSFEGKPLVNGTVLQVAAHPANSQELSLLTVDVATGALNSTLSVGTPTAASNYRGEAVRPTPVLARSRGEVYLLTNNGAVLALDPAAGRIDWAYKFPAVDQPSQNGMFFYSQPVRQNPLAAGAMLVVGSTLLAKETGSNSLVALDLAAAKLKWKRPMDGSVTLAAGEGANVLLVGTEADSIDVETRALQWSDKLSLDTGSVQPVVAGGHVYVFGGRGVHDVLASNGETGAIFRGIDREAMGGALWQTAGRLVTVSNLAVTAYPLGRTTTR